MTSEPSIDEKRQPHPRHPPKVLMVTGYLWGGGAEWHLLNLTWSLRRMGVMVDVAYVLDGAAGALRHWRSHGIEPIRVRWPWQISRLASKQYDLVHAHLFKGEILAAIVARVLRLPLVLTRHSLDWDNLPHWQRMVLRMLVHRQTAGVIAISQAVAAVCRRALAGHAAPMEVIPHGIAPELLATKLKGTDIRAELGLQGHRLIGTTARLSADKGLEHLLRAFHRAQDLLMGWHVVIAGDGPEKRRLEGLSRELGIADRVHWLGWREDPLDIVRALDIFALPSVREGFGLALLEAMTLGAAPVVSDLPSIRETAADAAVYVQPGDADALARALANLAADPTRREELFAKGKQQAAAFSAEQMARRTLAFYEALA